MFNKKLFNFFTFVNGWPPIPQKDNTTLELSAQVVKRNWGVQTCVIPQVRFLDIRGILALWRANRKNIN